ncbi:ABC transporter ATP-binding protein [Kitasatospora sp. NBC_01300]|uniref:ABC transporter ATP-binding protein n=1 Tax=Kitasatospora sp. NBC_01300 TaxID=2903574 RepID=UPI00352D6FF5|nr:ABC transporter ATP-binding protein [Kitasatospora sp. NBC_01300]
MTKTPVTGDVTESAGGPGAEQRPGPAPSASPSSSPSAPGSAASAGSAGSSRPDDVIRTRGLTKRFRGGQLAVDGLDLSVPRGSVFGFLGPNGSGKTTTIRMLMGLIAPTSGVATVLGEPMPQSVASVLPRVGALIEGPALYGFLSGRDNLVRFDAADPTADPRTRRLRVETALERVGLSAAAAKKARAYSLGMKQRLGLASALLQPRELLVLDEPTNGLDPQGMREIRALVREVAAEGTTVFLSSHLLDEIEQVCTHAAVMSRGRLVVQGTVAELAARAQGRLVVRTPDVAHAVEVLAAHRVGSLLPRDGRVDGDLGALGPLGSPVEEALPKLCAALVEAGVRVHGFGLERGTLEDAFVALTGEGFDVAG